MCCRSSDHFKIVLKDTVPDITEKSNALRKSAGEFLAKITKKSDLL